MLRWEGATGKEKRRGTNKVAVTRKHRGDCGIRITPLCEELQTTTMLLQRQSCSDSVESPDKVEKRWLKTYADKERG